jgi:succinyl-CoA synthetase beta subunit
LLYFASQGFDDNAKFRQKAVFDQEDTTESDPREVEAASHNLNYVQVGVYIFAIFFVFNVIRDRTN